MGSRMSFDGWFGGFVLHLRSIVRSSFNGRSTAQERPAQPGRSRAPAMLSLLVALPLTISTHVNAGSPFGPPGVDTSIDLSAMGAKFPKRTNETKEGEILVRFKDSVSPADRDASHPRRGNLKLRELKRSGVHQVLVSPEQTLEAALASYRNDPGVAYAEPNYAIQAMVTPNEPAFNQLWGLNNTGQTLGVPGADIRALSAWGITTGSSNVVVMVIDSGVDYTHPDLAANIWVNPGEIPGDGIDNDGNGYIDDVYGIDVVNGDSDPKDDYGHGTHVAGTIGAVGNNSLGVVGVNWNVKILPCKILDALGGGSIADAVTCLEYARELKARGVNIVATNNSYGGLAPFSQTMRDAIDAQRDILFVAAAGNFGIDNDTVDFFPANFKAPNVISVAATDKSDLMPDFTDFGRRTVHIGAPGVEITSTVPFNNYLSANGTSMAAPHVAGLAALLKAQTPSRDWRAIKNLLLSGGDVKPALTNKTITGRRLNAANAMTCADRPLFSVVAVPAAFTVNVANTVSVLSVNCASAAGPVTATTSSGQTFTLLDDGVAPDDAAGDGIFTATWTPAQGFSFIDFSSPAGSERLGAVDLTLTAVSGPTSATTGDAVTVSVTVSNPSATPAPASTINLYLSIDGIITDTDTIVGSAATPPLAAGEQAVVVADTTIPAAMQAGSYFLGAIVDPANTIDEGDETNNARAGNTIAIANIAGDLTVTTASGPATAFTGDNVTLSATVANSGSGNAGASSLYFFLATDPNVTGTYTLVGAAPVSALAAGATQPVSGSFALPTALPAATYTLVAYADGGNVVAESNENNNSRLGNLITTTTRSVDLTVTAVGAPKSVKDGASATFTATVKNVGSATAPSSTLGWYLSTDGVIATDDIPVATATVQSLSSGASASVSATVTIPADVPSGNYVVGAIADPANLVAETDETNNTRSYNRSLSLSFSSDLLMLDVSGPSTAVTGQDVTLSGTMRNQGGSAINQPINVGFYVSTDPVITTADQLIATTQVSSLANRTSVPVSVTATLRTDLTAGTYYIGAIADYDGAVAESDNNNNSVTGNAVAVTYGPDLTMTAVGAPATLTRTQTFTANGTLNNLGQGTYGSLSDLGKPLGGALRVGFYISTNPSVTANDTLIGSTTLTVVPAGSSTPLSVSVTLPPKLKAGTYYIGAIADDTGVLHESNEINNATTAANMVVVQP